MTQPNSTFCGSSPTWANACVGNNGSPGYWEYAKGFSRAANLMIDQVLQSRGLQYGVDDFIYPVCFNMRHSVELRLKGAIEELQIIWKIKNEQLEFDLSGSHDLSLIWNFFDTNSQSIDSRYTVINTELEARILDISDVDPTGQTFRYPTNTASQKHLVNIGVINFRNLKTKFNSLESELDTLHKLNIYLLDEYQQKSFTKHLPRNKIFQLARQLPQRSSWRKDSFDLVKKDIKLAYGLSNRELSLSIKIIENHYELAPLIGKSVTLEGISDIDVLEFLSQWIKLHDIPCDEDPIEFVVKDSADFETRFDETFARNQIREEAWEAMSGSLNAETLAGLKTLFYFSMELDFSEKYISMYKWHLEGEKKKLAQQTESLKREFFHLLSKTTVMYNFLRSLYFLKQNRLAETLVKSHGLSTKFSWLDKARSRKLFQKEYYCGYEV